MKLRILLTVPVLALIGSCDLLGLGAECSSDSDCDDDEECNDGECEELECTEDDDCDPGEECDDDECTAKDCTIDDDCGEGAFCDVDGKCDEIPTGEEGEGEGVEGEGEEGEGEGVEGEGEGPVGCGDVPATGQCVGDVIEFCDTATDTVGELDCDDTPLNPATVSCAGFVAAIGTAQCVVSTGSPCLFDDAGTPTVTLCAGASPGCQIENLEVGTCVTNAGTCSLSDELTCSGDRFIVLCQTVEGGSEGQPVIMDCGNLGATCTTSGCLFGAGDACVPEVSACGDAAAPTQCPANGLCP